MKSHWTNSAIFYHIYPLGLCGAPRRNDFSAGPVARLEQLYPWLDHIQSLGANALYLGPLFESTAHGYDTADYYQVDRRLGTNETLAALARELHRRGLRLVLDGVFNHVGRDFWAFRDVQANGQGSAYAGWFKGLDFGKRSPYGDAFAYDGWSGNFDLVRLDGDHPDVRRHLLDAVTQWTEQFGIDGLRLDAADQLSDGFLEALGAHCRGLRSDFWLMGEIVFGDYRRLLGPGRCDSVTNYEAYKGLYSSLNDHNYFEIAYALKRQFGEQGIYRGFGLYNFADNHDVDRVASRLKDAAHLYPLYALLFSMPGIPSVYYGSEWGLPGARTPHSDAALRPALDLARAAQPAPQPDLPAALRKLAAVRGASPALQRGDYHELYVSAGQLAFERALPGERVIVALNASPEPIAIDMPIPEPDARLVDLLNPGEEFALRNGKARVEIPPTWGRIMRMLNDEC
ncbi:glycosidase [Longilinea arvoryzae]|uniref:Glycosidase n=1 Tax=Longilinea arvoryzae TaxID=360412 RepID=A0A0S7BDH7_9CHLR|nr:alpha-amylase family glycosyl hydrolase [Longilinea arvoryzae]GAP12880.1 glycosidase [Longilinea arvoryzae]